MHRPQSTNVVINIVVDGECLQLIRFVIVFIVDLVADNEFGAGVGMLGQIKGEEAVRVLLIVDEALHDGGTTQGGGVLSGKATDSILRLILRDGHILHIGGLREYLCRGGQSSEHHCVFASDTRGTAGAIRDVPRRVGQRGVAGRVLVIVVAQIVLVDVGVDGEHPEIGRASVKHDIIKRLRRSSDLDLSGIHLIEEVGHSGNIFGARALRFNQASHQNVRTISGASLLRFQQNMAREMRKRILAAGQRRKECLIRISKHNPFDEQQA
mmetsp:Transcript_65779/g.104786  ORF Transcript_65779/g.104786 Transcript_65779/m.104786 type:complete len:268 (+) Transcript_65779:1286-2089(+)